MRIWLIHVGEPLPIDRGDARQLRMSLLASRLTALDHEVLWWSSTFDHNHKRQRYDTDARIPVADNYALYLLKGTPYSSNVSLRRWLNHYQLAHRFRRLALTEPTPDVLVCTIPTLELAAAAVSFARQHSIPAILDVRDLWPDAIAEAFPKPVRSAVDLLLLPMQHWARRAIRGADALTAVSPSYLHWAVSRAGRPRSACDRVFPLAYPRSDVALQARTAAAEALRKLGVDQTKKIVWFIGIFGRSYDLSTAIRAAHHLARLGRHDLQFVFCGSGDRMERWIREAAGLETVTFTGWVDRAAISYLMSVAWVGLAAYVPEAPQSLPNKLFEYMSAGLPVLSSLSGDAAELLARHRCGLTYRAGDSRHLAESLLILLDDQGLRAEMARNAGSAYQQHYAAERVYAEMANFVLEIARRSSAATATGRRGS